MRTRIAALTLLLSPLAGQQYGNIGKVAPPLGVTQWQHLAKGQTTLDLETLRGKVVYLYCFQAYCPKCRTHGYPLLAKLVQRYRSRPDVAFVSVQTIFEGYSHNSPKAGSALHAKHGLKIPLGYDPGPKGGRSIIVDRYNTGGTPWSIVIDRHGIVRFNSYSNHTSEAKVAAVIDQLRKEKTLLGKKIGSLEGLAFADQPWRFDQHKFTLLRFWTGGSYPCFHSLPALNDLAREHKDLDVLAVFYPSPARKVEVDAVVDVAVEYNFGGPVAVDAQWQLLKRLQARGLPKTHNNVSLLVDRKGTIRWIHAGPRIHKKLKGQHADAAYALAALERQLGGQKPKKTPARKKQSTGR